MATTTDWRLWAIAIVASAYTLAWRGIALIPLPAAPAAAPAPRPHASVPAPVRSSRPLRVRTRSS